MKRSSDEDFFLSLKRGRAVGERELSLKFVQNSSWWWWWNDDKTMTTIVLAIVLLAGDKNDRALIFKLQSLIKLSFVIFVKLCLVLFDYHRAVKLFIFNLKSRRDEEWNENVSWNLSIVCAGFCIFFSPSITTNQPANPRQFSTKK